MAVAALAGTSFCEAQVVLDGTLGPAGPRLGPNYIIPRSVGTLRGGNLFHSFSELSVRKGESVTFSGASGTPVRNIFARVTGGIPSTIRGAVRSTIPSADLYLINPAGVVFGPEATLDVQGSFAVSTAPLLRFEDGLTFSATAIGNETLSSAAPTAFGFLSAVPAPLRVDGNVESERLTVPDAKTITLVGGDITVRSRVLRSPGGQINLYAGGPNAEFPVVDRSDAVAPRVAPGRAMGTIQLLDGASLIADVGGRAVIRGGNLTMRGGSPPSSNPDEPARSSVITTDTQDVRGGGVDVSLAGRLDLRLARISSDARGSAPGGDIRLHADSITVRGFSADGTEPISVIATGAGDAGDIRVETGDLTLLTNATISALANGKGNGGGISVSASRRVLIDGTGRTFVTGFAAETQTDATGNSGSISLTADAIDILNNGEVTSTTKGAGNAGDITITANRLNIDGGDLLSLTGLQARVGLGEDRQGATGNGGKIDVTVGQLRLARGGVLSATTLGLTKGGDIDVDADRITLIGSPRSQFTGIFARSARKKDAAPGGTIEIDTDTLDINGNASINALSVGKASAGAITVRATDSVRLTDGGSISTRARRGDAGRIDITAGGDIVLSDSRDGVPSPIVAVDQDGEPATTRITAEALRGSDGNIFLSAANDVILTRSLITAEAGKIGGRIEINSRFVVLNNSVINGRSSGMPVTVLIAPDALLIQSVDSAILTDAPALPPPTDIAGALVPFADTIITTDPGLLDVCAIRFEGPISSFLVQGRNGLPSQPGGWIADTAIRP